MSAVQRELGSQPRRDCLPHKPEGCWAGEQTDSKDTSSTDHTQLKNSTSLLALRAKSDHSEPVATLTGTASGRRYRSDARTPHGLRRSGCLSFVAMILLHRYCCSEAHQDRLANGLLYRCSRSGRSMRHSDITNRLADAVATCDCSGMSGRQQQRSAMHQWRLVLCRQHTPGQPGGPDAEVHLTWPCLLRVTRPVVVVLLHVCARCLQTSP